MHAIYWKKQAINELIKIGQHIAKDNPANAEKMVDLIEKKVTPLAVHSRMGRMGRKQGTYELVVHQSYVVVYRIIAMQAEVLEVLEVLRVKHTAQQWPSTSRLQ